MFREELAAVTATDSTATDSYENEEAFLTDAVRTFLAACPDLREAMACKLYERGDSSLGRAAEWSSLPIEAMKESLHSRGIVRQADESPAETAAMAHEMLKAAGRTTR